MGNERKLFFLADIFFRDQAVDSEILQVVSMLKKDLELWLVVDLPEEEFEKIQGSGTLKDSFHKTVYLDEQGLSYGAMETYEFLYDQTKIPHEQCLFLDCNLKRTVQAINNGIYAAVITDKACLEREFLLRRLTDQEYVLHRRPE